MQFVRTTASVASFSRAVAAFILWGKWRTISVVASNQIRLAYAVAPLATALRAASVMIAVDVRFDPQSFNPYELDRIAAADARVALVVADSADVLDIALHAKERGLITKGWGWLSLKPIEPHQSHEEVEAAKAALAFWVFFRPQGGALPFSRNATAAGFRKAANDGSVRHAINLYNAITLYAVVAGRSPAALMDGRGVVANMWNVSFEGKGGRVEFDANGDMKEAIEAHNVIDIDATIVSTRLVGVFDAITGQYVSGQSSIIWPGNTADKPIDQTEVKQHQTVVQLGVALGLGCFVVCVFAVLAYLIIRNRERAKEMFLSFMSFEGSLLTEVCSEVWNVISTGLLYEYIVDRRKEIDWLGKLFIPYTTFFVLACMVTITSIGIKVRLVLIKLRSRFAGASSSAKNLAQIVPEAESPMARSTSAADAFAMSKEGIVIANKTEYNKVLTLQYLCTPLMSKPSPRSKP